MIADEMKEYCYSEEEMMAILGGSRGPLSRETMRRRARKKTNCPPWIKVGPDYWFPKEAYADWLRAIPMNYEVKSAS